MASNGSVENYICVALYQPSSDDPNLVSNYEERLILLKATSEVEAKSKSQKLTTQTHEYKNKEGFTVIWRCIKIVDISPMVDDSFFDGAQLYSRFFDDLSSYENFEPHNINLENPNA